MIGKCVKVVLHRHCRKNLPEIGKIVLESRRHALNLRKKVSEARVSKATTASTSAPTTLTAVDANIFPLKSERLYTVKHILLLQIASMLMLLFARYLLKFLSR